MAPHVNIRYAPASVSDEYMLGLRNRRTLEAAYARGDRSVVLKGKPSIRNFPFVPAALGPRDSIGTDRKLPYRMATLNVTTCSDRVMPEIVMETSLETGFRDLRLYWKRILGQGGFGIATLWRVEFEDGYKDDIVIKFSNHNGHNILSEYAWHRRYQMARRIIQTPDLAEMAKAHRKGERFSRGIEFNPIDLKVLPLEYMCHGNLYNILVKASMLRLRFTNAALWQLWACLVEGLAEVSYQRDIRYRWKESFNQVFRAVQAEGLDATDHFLKFLDNLDNSHDVHFDLEETNILVSQDREGNMIFKLHDFCNDHSHIMRKCWEDWTVEDYWKARHQVKDGKNLPEKCTKEWDSLSLEDPLGVNRFVGEDLNDPQKAKVAGRFGSWSNVFLIARTLESAITLSFPRHPFKAKKCPSHDPELTYGWRLGADKYKCVDEDLLEAILRCMREKPAARDTVVQLLRIVVLARAQGRMDMDAETRGFWAEVTQPADEIAEESDPSSSIPSRIEPSPSEDEPPPPAPAQERNPRSPRGGRGGRTRRPTRERTHDKFRVQKDNKTRGRAAQRESVRKMTERLTRHTNAARGSQLAELPAALQNLRKDIIKEEERQGSDAMDLGLG